MTQPDLTRITRLTVVDNTGRAYEKFGGGQFFKMTDPYRPEAS